MHHREKGMTEEAVRGVVEREETIESLGANVPLFIVTPSDEGPFPSVLICHEVTGLTEHIRNLARRLAGEGYLAAAINLFPRERPVSGRGYQRQLELLHVTPESEMVDDACAAIEYLRGMPQARPQSIAIWGFSMGARVATLAAERLPDLAACVAYYATVYRPPEARQLFSYLLDRALAITPPLFCIYGDEDEVSPADKVEELRSVLEARTAPWDLITYPGARHAFFSPESRNYHPAFAADAWERTLAFLRSHTSV